MEPSFRARAALEGLGQLLEQGQRHLIRGMAPAMLAALREALVELEGQHPQAVGHWEVASLPPVHCRQ